MSPSPGPSQSRHAATLPGPLGDPDAWLWRLGAAVTGIYSLVVAFSLLAVPMQANPGWLGPLFVTLAGGIAGLLAAAVVQPSARLYRAISLYIPAMLLIAAFCSALFTIAVAKPYPSDETAFAADATRLMLHGIDPYVAAMRAPVGFTSGPFTPTALGTYVRSFSYPALGFLAYVPWQALGVQTIAFANLAYMLMALCAFLIWAPPRWRFASLALILLAVPVTSGVVTWVDYIDLLPLLATVRYFRERPLVAAAAYGVACAAKQVPWLAAPFLLVAVWHEARAAGRAPARDALRWAATALAAFAVFNLPFIVWHPMAWLRGTMTPMFGHLAALGVGLVEVSHLPYHALPPNALFFIAIGSLALGAALVAAVYRQAPAVVFIPPMVAFLLASRSLPSYVQFYLPVAFLALGLWGVPGAQLAGDKADMGATAAPARAPVSRPFVAATALLGALLIAGGIYDWARQPDSAFARVIALRTPAHRPARLLVVAENTSARPLPVTYFITSPNALFIPWLAPKADRVLAPHQTLRLVLTQPGPSVTLPGKRLPVGSWVQVTLVTPTGVAYAGPVRATKAALEADRHGPARAF